MRLLIVDDHEVVRRGVRSLLSDQSGWVVCGEAVDGQDAIEKARELKPDVIVMDVSMPRLNGLEATRQIRNILPTCEVLVLSQHENNEMARQALKAGARGYVVKSSISRDLIAAVEKVSQGNYFFDTAILNQTSPAHTDVQEILQRSAAFQKALRDSEELYRSTFELTAVGIAHVSAEGRWLRVNRKLCEIVGYTESELLQRTFQDITHPEDLATDLAQTARIKKREIRTYSLEKRYIRKDRSIVWINLTVSGVWDETDEFKHFISVIEDITDRTFAEQELRNSKERLAAQTAELRRSTKMMSRAQLCVRDMDDRITYWNRGAEELYGFTEAEALGQVSHWLFKTQFPMPLGAIRAQLMEVGEWDGELVHTRRDGSQITVTSHWSLHRDERGQAVAILEVNTDITAHKQVEARLRQNEEQLVLALQSSKSAIFDWDVIQRRGHWNPQMSALYGFQPNGEYITAEEWMQLFHPDDMNRLREEAEQFWARGEEFRFEFRTAPRNGQFKWMTSHGRTVRDAEGNPVRMIGIHTDITDRKRAEQGLQQRQAELNEAQRLAKIGSWHWTPATDTVIWSDELYRIAGRDPKLPAVSYQDHPTLYTPDSWERLQVVVNEALKNGTPYSTELEMIRADGDKRWIIATGETQRDAQGKVIALRGTVQDITDRKRMEEATGLLAAIVTSSDDAVVSKNLDGVIQSWNAGAEHIFGYTAREAIGQHIKLIIPPDLHPEENEILARLRRGERIDHFQTVRRRKDGTLIDVSVTISPVRDTSGRVIGASKVARDITAQKLVERALRESEQRFRMVTDAAPLLVWLSGIDKLCYYFNKGWLDFVGRTLEQESGNGWAENVHPDDFDRCLQIYVSNFDARRPFEMEYRLRHHSGQYRWVLDRGVPRYAPDGTFEGYVGGCLDIHDRKEAAEKIRIADETVRLMKAQDEERRRIARELHDSAGQTLTVLGLNLAQLVQNAEQVAPELAKQGKEIEETVQQLHREIRTTTYLLHPPLLDECGLSSALNWYVQGVAERSGIAIELNVSEDLGRLPADMELAIFRIVQECLTNIHRHAESKTAFIRVARESGGVCIEVGDEGKGVTPERLADIHSRGSGVGISGIRERLRQFNGEMRIESNGSGTIVFATIPLAKGAPLADQEPLQATV